MLATIKRFVAPPQFPEDEETARVANLLNALLWLFLGTYTSLAVFMFITGGGDQTTFIITAVVNVIPLYLLKQRLVKAASWTTLIILYGGTFLNVFFVFGLTLASVSSIFALTMLSGLLLGRRILSFSVVLSVVLLNLALYMQTAGQIIPQEPDFGTALILTANLFLLGIALNLTLRDLNRASNHMQQSNEKLLAAQEGLAQMVAARTHELESAADVGRSISQIRELDVLLQNAVDSIAAQFNLYYVQIYLADKKQRVLSLQSGSGSVGQQMVRRGHKLPFGGGSINGMAAAKQQVVLVTDTAVSPLFKPNALLRYTRSEMAVPLMLGDAVIGILDLQSDVVNGLNGERLPAFEALAGQIAIAIENARLFTETTQARSETEAYLRRMTRQGWTDYFDAIQRPERLGYSYDTAAEEIIPGTTLTTAHAQNMMQVPIVLNNEVVGTIELEADDDQAWTNETLDMVTAVAQQVGQRVENLRLFDEAEQSRFEAEQANRRLTREGWQAYQENLASPGFVYDGTEVKPHAAGQEAGDSDESVSLPLQVRGEAIGQLVLAGVNNIDEETQTLLTAVTQQLSDHVENLRLAEQTERALGDAQRRERELSVINAVAKASADIIVIHDFLEAVHHQLEQVLPMNSFTASTYDATENLIGFEYAYDEKNGMLENPPPIQLEPYHLSYKTIHEATPQIVHFTAAEIEEQKRNRPPNMMSAEASLMASLLFVPLISGQEVIGIISAQSYHFNVYTQEHISLLTGVAGYVTTAIQKARLFAQTQARAEELAVINEVAQIVAQETDQRALLEAVYTQIQRIMTVDAYFVALYHASENSVAYPFVFENDRIFAIPPEPLDERSQMKEVIHTTQPIFHNWTPEEVRNMQEAEELAMLGDAQTIPTSLIFVPLLLGQDVLGVLSVQAYEVNAYTQADVDLLSGIAKYVALALENSRLLTETRQTAAREQLLREISATINTSIDAESVLQTAAREIGRAIGAETYVYLTPDISTTKPIAPVNGKKNETA